MGCIFKCDECGAWKIGIHIKDYLFAKPRTWFQRSIMEDGSVPGKKVESKVLIACSRKCALKLEEKYPKSKIDLKLVKK